MPAHWAKDSRHPLDARQIWHFASAKAELPPQLQCI